MSRASGFTEHQLISFPQQLHRSSGRSSKNGQEHNLEDVTWHRDTAHDLSVSAVLSRMMSLESQCVTQYYHTHPCLSELVSHTFRESCESAFTASCQAILGQDGRTDRPRLRHIPEPLRIPLTPSSYVGLPDHEQSRVISEWEAGDQTSNQGIVGLAGAKVGGRYMIIMIHDLEGVVFAFV